VDEDEIIDKVLKKYTVPALDTTGNKTTQKMLAKKAGRRAAEVVLESTHKLTHAQVP